MTSINVNALVSVDISQQTVDYLIKASNLKQKEYTVTAVSDEQNSFEVSYADVPFLNGDESNFKKILAITPFRNGNLIQNSTHLIIGADPPFLPSPSFTLILTNSAIEIGDQINLLILYNEVDES